MTIKLSTTKANSKFKKILVYGKSGTRKTLTCATAKNPIIITSENKLESISDKSFDIVKVKSIEEFDEAIDFVLKKKIASKHDWCCIDSISDIHLRAIAEETKNHNHQMKAYAVVNPIFTEIIKKIRDSNRINFYIICRQKRYENDEGNDQYGPEMGGNKLAQDLPYEFDYVFAMRIAEAEEKEDAYSYLQTNVYVDSKYDAKDSSGLLKGKEKPDLQYLLKKLQKGKK